MVATFFATRTNLTRFSTACYPIRSQVFVFFSFRFGLFNEFFFLFRVSGSTFDTSVMKSKNASLPHEKLRKHTKKEDFPSHRLISSAVLSRPVSPGS